MALKFFYLMKDNIGEAYTALGRTRQVFIMWLFALATIPIFDFGTISLSFVFGAALIITSLKDYRFFIVPRGLTSFLLLFVVVALIGLAITEVPATKTTPVRALQLVYWFLLAVFVYNTYEHLDKILLSKVVFIAAILFVSLDLIFNFNSQNGIAFTVIIMGPLGYFFPKKYFHKLIYVLLLMFLMLLNGSRTGAVLVFVQTILFLLLFTPRLSRYAKTLLFTILILAVNLNITPVRVAVGKMISPVNERVGELLINSDKVFRNDMSWLQRRAQVNKGKQIFKLHPVLGIGIFNFSRYDIDIDVSNIDTDRKMIRNIDNRSAHNSYVAILSETGFLGFSAIILMFASALWPFIRKLNLIGGTFEGCIFISTIGMLVYFYTISSFFGTSSWIMYGLILGASAKIKWGYTD